MGKVFIEESTLTAIGDSIRAKTGKTDMIPPLQMPTEIASIHSGGDATMKTVEGTLPLTVDGVGQRLEDYKIYGAEGGVGEKTKNLCSGVFNVTTKFDEPIPAGTVISVSASANGYDATDQSKKLRVRFFDSTGAPITNFYPALVESENRIKMDKLSYTKDIYSYWLSNLNAEEVQIEVGPVHTDYEPYGYCVGIKVNEATSKVYIKEQLGADDYIDFENRTLVIGGVSTMMELPEIHLSNGTNIIDVDTVVKPSKMSVSFVDNGQSNNGASV